MNEHLKLTAAGANLIKHFEGVKEKCGPDLYKPYKCPANVLTIGFGHTNHHGRKFDASTRWTSSECHKAFLEDMEGFERAVRKLVRVPLTSWQFDSLTSLCYNIGEGNLGKSTLLQYVNQQKWDLAAKEFIRWNKGGGKVLPGLTRRRKSEALLFQNIPDLNYDGTADPRPPEHPMAQAVDVPSD